MCEARTIGRESQRILATLGCRLTFYSWRIVMEDEQQLSQLPIVNCDDCGACCMDQSSPRWYFALLCNPQLGNEDDPDWQRFKNLPKDALQSLLDHKEKVGKEGGKSKEPCCWLDLETKRCKWYEHRPDMCRDFEVGCEGCHSWREEYLQST